MNKRWTRDEEMRLIKDISAGKDFYELADNYNRSSNALELRIKKIIYDNIQVGKTIEQLSRILNMSPQRISNYYDHYRDINKKNNDKIENNKEDKVSERNDKNNQDNENVKDMKKKMDKIKKENKILKMIINNIEYRQKINNLIRNGSLDKDIKKIINDLLDYT